MPSPCLHTIALLMTFFSATAPFAYGIVSTTNGASTSTIYELNPIVQYVPAPHAKPTGPSLYTTWSTKSASSAKSTFVIFDNRSLISVEVRWIDFKGKEVLYKTLSKGSIFTQKTFSTHPWVVRDATSKAFLTMFVATEKPLLYTIY